MPKVVKKRPAELVSAVADQRMCPGIIANMADARIEVNFLDEKVSLRRKMFKMVNVPKKADKCIATRFLIPNIAKAIESITGQPIDFGYQGALPWCKKSLAADIYQNSSTYMMCFGG